MIAYHVDRANSLAEGKVIDVLPFSHLEDTFLGHNLKIAGFAKASMFALNEMASCPLRPGMVVDFYSLNSNQIDCFYDRIRAPKTLPSRFLCLYAVEHLDELKAWKSILCSSDFSVWEVKCDSGNILKVDAQHLRGVASGSTLLDHDRLRVNAIKYWSGELSEDPLPELLLPLPVTAVRKVSLPERFFD